MSKSSNYLVHLNTFLCEASMHVVNKSRLNFLSYNSFCKHYALLIEKGNIAERELSIINQIYEYANQFLCLSREDFIKYLHIFFKLPPEELLTYQRIVIYRRKYSIN